MKMKLFILTLLMIIAVSAGNTYSAFEKAFIGDARVIGIGAVAAQCDGSYSVFINPAGIVRLQNQELSLTGANIYGGLDYVRMFRVNGAYVLPMGKLGSIGIGIDRYMVKVEVEGADGFKYSETLYVVSYARKISKKFALGGNLTIPRISMDLPDDPQKQQIFSMGIDVGFIFVLNQYISIGGSASDVNMPRIGTGSDRSSASRIPVGFRAGMSFDTQKRFLVNFDVSYNDRIDVALGTEFNLKKLFLRWGMQFMSVTEAIDASLGIGYVISSKRFGIKLDYAFKISLGRVIGNAGTHFITSSFLFAAPKRFGYVVKKDTKLGLATYESGWRNDFNDAKKYIEKKKYEKAIKALKEVISKNNSHVESYYELACIYSIENRPDDSLANIRKVLELDINMKNRILEDEKLRNVRKTDGFELLFRDIGEDVEERPDAEKFQPTDIFDE